MEKHIKDLFNDGILKLCKEKFGVSEVKDLGGFENFIYEYRKDNQDYILRISHSDHRKIDELQAEIEFVQYLAQCGSAVCTPIKSINGHLVEKVSCDKGYFSASSFTKAKGRHIKKEDISNEFFVEYGRVMGEFHRLSKSFKPQVKRFEWYQDPFFVNSESYLPENEKHIDKKFKKVIDEIKKLPIDSDSYGLIHTDIHMGNFFIDENVKLTVFDFDDCAYKHYISDIAIAIYYYVEHIEDDEKKAERAKQFFIYFMKGYYKENKLDVYWIKQLPLFLKLREILLYIALFRSFDLKNLPEWAEGYLKNYKPRIEAEVPFVNVDFSTLI